MDGDWAYKRLERVVKRPIDPRWNKTITAPVRGPVQRCFPRKCIRGLWACEARRAAVWNMAGVEMDVESLESDGRSRFSFSSLFLSSLAVHPAAPNVVADPGLDSSDTYQAASTLFPSRMPEKDSIMLASLSSLQRFKQARDLAESPPPVDGFSPADARDEVEDEYRPLMDGEDEDEEADEAAVGNIDKGDTLERRSIEVSLSYGAFLVLGRSCCAWILSCSSI
jgi:hypothetical protein